MKAHDEIAPAINLAPRTRIETLDQPCIKGWVRTAHANKLLAEVIAWKSPVKCKLIFSIGITWAYPPPAAPPFIPKLGPKLGSLRQTILFFPILHNPSFNPTEVVVFPSPAGVGVIAVTKISLDFFSGILFAFSSTIFAEKLPNKWSDSSVYSRQLVRQSQAVCQEHRLEPMELGKYSLRERKSF